MIYTVTFNPAIDYVIHTPEVRLGTINRSLSEEVYYGGKGINVSIVLHELGIPSKALGFVAGFTGLAIEQNIAAMKIETDFIHLERGLSRINVKIKAGTETEINGQGPQISSHALEQLYKKLDKLTDNDILVLAGSIPKGLPSSVYEDILQRMSLKHVRSIVDASGELLLRVLKYHPFLIKPNLQELEELFGKKFADPEAAVVSAKKLQEMGAVNVLVSMAGNGAFLWDEYGELHRCTAHEGIVRNSVGAGDSMVAGFLAGWQDGGYESALRLGNAAGGATAFSDGLAKKEAIQNLLH